MKFFRDLPLKRAFFTAMLCTVAAIVALSALTLWGCLALQRILLPDSDELYLNITTTYEDGTQETFWQRMAFGSEETLGQLVPEDEGAAQTRKGVSRYSVDRVENSFQSLSPRRQLAYSALSAAMVALPAVYSLAGVLLCAAWFYRKKLDRPIKLLWEATEHIAREDLDFTVSYDSADEMGALCGSFETMRRTLFDNNRALWALLEERRMLQASVAHDLRNPISIIEGYAEFLQENLPGGKLPEDKLQRTVNNLWTAAKRLERYTDSLRELHQLEDLEVRRAPCPLPQVLAEMGEDLTVLARQEGLALEVHCDAVPCEGALDSSVLYRILENLVSNALRFARKTVSLSFSLEDGLLTCRVRDDGPGFPEKVLASGERTLFSPDPTGTHIGMGLVISRILCRKHGGTLTLKNLPEGGAEARAQVSVQAAGQKKSLPPRP